VIWLASLLILIIWALALNHVVRAEDIVVPLLLAPMLVLFAIYFWSRKCWDRLYRRWQALP